MISQKMLVSDTNDDETDREEYILGDNAFDGNGVKNRKNTGGLRVKAVSEINRSRDIARELVSVSAVEAKQILATSNSRLKRKLLVWTVEKVPAIQKKATTFIEPKTSSNNNSNKKFKVDAIHINKLEADASDDDEENALEVANNIPPECKAEPAETVSDASADEYDADNDREDDIGSCSIYVPRGKNRNSTQVQIFLEFMEAHPDLANNSINIDRVSADALWTDLTRKLNINGPPRKEVVQWRKVWADWKCIARKKLSQNINKIEITHGKQIHKYKLNYKERAIARICHLYDSVENVLESHEINVSESKDKEAELFKCDETKEIPELRTALYDFRTKIINCENPMQSVQKHLTAELSAVQNIASSMGRILNNSKENTKIRAENNNDLQKVHESLEKLTQLISQKNTLIGEQNKERRNQYMEIEKTAAGKNKLKWKKFEIERLKFEKEILERGGS